MKKREKLIDAMADIDEDLLVAHAQVKKPTRAQKIRKYLGAAMIYVAACLVVALILPFVIGNDEPKPQPGEKPIVVETHSPVTDDPEAKKINAADIYKTYCEVDPEKMSEPVTLDEVKAIIAAAEKAYAEYDIIILQDETAVETTPKKPDVKFSDLKDSGEEDSKVAQLTKYNYQMFTIIREVFEVRFPTDAWVCSIAIPEPSVPQNDNEHDVSRPYAFILESSSDEENPDMIDVSRENVIFTVKHVTKDENGKENETVIYPYDKDYQILTNHHNSHVYYPNDLPMTTAEFDGLELTILLEKDCYLINENITATVVLENVGDEAKILYQDDDLHFLDDIMFLENGEERPQYSEEKNALKGWHGVRFDPGDYIIYSEELCPFKPYDPSAEPASMDSLWEIEATVEYFPRFINESDYNSDKSFFDERVTGTVRINVPHDTDVDAVPDPDSVVVGYEGKSGSFIREDSYYPCELLYRRANEAFEENGDIMQVWHAVFIDEIREKYPYAEFVYDTPKTVRMRDYVTDNMINTEPVKRICFTQTGNDYLLILSKDDAYERIYGVYVYNGFKNVIDAVDNIAEDFAEKMTEATEPPETTTTTAPPETEPPVVIPELKEGQSIVNDFIVDSVAAIKYIGRGGDVVIPEGVQFLDSGIFDDCSTITSITFPTTLHGQALDGSPETDNLDEMVAHIPTLTHYYFAEGHSQFSSYDGLITVSYDENAYISWVPPGRTEITVPSFINSGVKSGQGLENIYVEDGHPTYTSYNGILFSKDRTKLCTLPARKTVFTMPPEFTDSSGFLWSDVCKNIERYEVDPANKKYCSIDGVLYSKSGSDVYLVHVPYSRDSYTFPDNCTDTWKYPFSGNTGIRSLEVPLQIKVDYSAWNLFSGCKNLESVTIHQFVDTADYMFSGCTSLRSVYLPEIIKVIRTGCFYGCTSLETVTIPLGVTKIESGAFAGCTSLVDVYIPDSVTEIEKNAFGNESVGYTSPNVVIRCSAGSYAAKYAAENGIAWTAN